MHMEGTWCAHCARYACFARLQVLCVASFSVCCQLVYFSVVLCH